MYHAILDIRILFMSEVVGIGYWSYNLQLTTIIGCYNIDFELDLHPLLSESWKPCNFLKPRQIWICSCKHNPYFELLYAKTEMQ